jgi:hypothetical protein
MSRGGIRTPTFASAILFSLVAAVISTAGLTQPAPATNYTGVEATAGNTMQLTYHASAHKNCTPAPLVTFDVHQAPKLDVLTVRKGALTTDKVAGCPGLKIPVQVVFYQVRAGSAGPDHIIYKVASAGGEVETYDVTIAVKPAPAPSPPSGEKANSL